MCINYDSKQDNFTIAFLQHRWDHFWQVISKKGQWFLEKWLQVSIFILELAIVNMVSNIRNILLLSTLLLTTPMC